MNKKDVQGLAKSLGQEIRDLRKGTIAEFAEDVGVNPVYITQIEKHGKMPSPKVMKLVLDKLRLPPDEKLRMFLIYLSIKHPEAAELWLEFGLDKKARAGVKELLEKHNKIDPSSLIGQLADREKK